jgi:hypothetical protein
MNYKIGTITLAEPETFRQSYETASWYTDYAIPAGTYDVYAHVEWTSDGGGRSQMPYYGVSYACKGTVTGSLFINRLFTASSVKKDEDVGQVRDVRVRVSLQDARLTLIDNLFPNGAPRTYETPAVNLDVLKAYNQAAERAEAAKERAETLAAIRQVRLAQLAPELDTVLRGITAYLHGIPDPDPALAEWLKQADELIERADKNQPIA